MRKYGEVLDYTTASKAVVGKQYILGDYLRLLQETPQDYLPEKLCEVCEQNSNPFVNYAGCAFQFCREVIEEEFLMTNRQLAEWCSEGKGLWKHSPSNSGTVYHYYWFLEPDMNKEVPNNIVIMAKSSDEWVKPTVDIYNRDCKEG